MIIKIAIIVASIAIFMGVGSIVWDAKNNNALKNRMKIHFAINNMALEAMQAGDTDAYNEIMVNLYDNMEPYDKTFWRFWDWGYKSILPPEKFKLVEPYIDKDSKAAKKKGKQK